MSFITYVLNPSNDNMEIIKLNMMGEDDDEDEDEKLKITTTKSFSFFRKSILKTLEFLFEFIIFLPYGHLTYSHVFLNFLTFESFGIISNSMFVLAIMVEVLVQCRCYTMFIKEEKS